MALFGLYQAIFMANAGGCWDNAKKVVETELRAKGTELHAASVVGDTVGDPFKDTSSVALNPVIKFTTLFGVLAVGLALELHTAGHVRYFFIRHGRITRAKIDGTREKLLGPLAAANRVVTHQGLGVAWLIRLDPFFIQRGQQMWSRPRAAAYFRAARASLPGSRYG